MSAAGFFFAVARIVAHVAHLLGPGSPQAALALLFLTQEIDMFRIGSWVGGERWPNRTAHPDQWGRPIGGQVLDPESSVAWANTPEFPTSQPSGAEVMNHVLALRKQGKLVDAVPVLWDFGDGTRVIKWERASRLRPYKDDMSLWKAAMAMRRDELAHPRRQKPRSLAEFLPEDLKHLAPADA